MDGYFEKRSFGGWLRDERKRHGYKRGQAFVDALFKKGGYAISERSYMELERGNTEPSASVLMAISITLYGEVLSNEIVHALRFAVSGRAAAHAAFPERFEGLDRKKWENAVIVKSGSLSDGFYRVALLDPDTGEMTDQRSIDLSGDPRKNNGKR